MASAESSAQGIERPISHEEHFRSRLWIGTTVILVSNLIFALADLWISPDNLLPLWSCKAVQIVEILWIRGRLRASPPTKELEILAVLMLGTVTLMTAVSGYFSNDLATAPILSIAVLLAAAGLLPWSLNAQVILAIWTAVVVGAQFAVLGAALQYGLVAVVSGAVCSVILLSLLEKRRLVVENSERVARDREKKERRISDTLLMSSREIIEGLDHENLLLRFCEIVAEHLECNWVVAVEVRSGDDDFVFVPVAQTGLTANQWQRFDGVPLDRSVANSMNTDFSDEIAQSEIPDIRPGRDSGPGLSVIMIRLATKERVHALVTAWRGPGQERFGDAEHRISRGLAPLLSASYEQRSLLNQVEKVQKWQENFLANLSHELRTPLNIILGYMEMLMDKQHTTGEENIRDLQERVRRSAQSQLHLVNEALEISRRDEGGGLVVRLEQVDIPRLVDDLVGETRLRITGDAVEVSGRVDGIMKISTDAVKLRMILGNLLENSRKFTKTGTIELLVGLKGGYVSFEVRDTGRGIPEELQPALFDAFRQGTRGDPGGLGLGLYIVRRLVESLDGRVDVSSHPGEGSTFTIRLPHATIES